MRASRLALPLLAALSLGACENLSPTQRTAAIGGGTGAGLGALAGSFSGNAGWGALLGGGLGAATGYIYEQNQETQRRGRYNDRRYDDRRDRRYRDDRNYY